MIWNISLLFKKSIHHLLNIGIKILTTSLCICTYNNYKLLIKCLESASNQSALIDEYEIIILDNTPPETIAKEKRI